MPGWLPHLVDTVSMLDATDWAVVTLVSKYIDTTFITIDDHNSGRLHPSTSRRLAPTAPASSNSLPSSPCRAQSASPSHRLLSPPLIFFSWCHYRRGARPHISINRSLSSKVSTSSTLVPWTSLLAATAALLTLPHPILPVLHKVLLLCIIHLV